MMRIRLLIFVTAAFYSIYQPIAEFEGLPKDPPLAITHLGAPIDSPISPEWVTNNFCPILNPLNK